MRRCCAHNEVKGGVVIRAGDRKGKFLVRCGVVVVVVGFDVETSYEADVVYRAAGDLAGKLLALPRTDFKHSVTLHGEIPRSSCYAQSVLIRTSLQDKRTEFSIDLVCV